MNPLPDPSDPRLDNFMPLWRKVHELRLKLGVDHPDYQAANAELSELVKLKLELGLVEEPDED